MSIMSSNYVWNLAALVLTVGLVFYVWELTSRLPASIPSSIPWVGLRNEFFSKPKAWIRELRAGLSTLQDGYVTVSNSAPHGSSLVPDNTN